MKKFMALFMATCMVVLSFGVATTVFADEVAADTVLFTESFAGDLSNWICYAESCPAIDKNLETITEIGNTTDVLWSWSNGTFGHNLETPVTEGTVVFSFDINPNKLISYNDGGERSFSVYVGGEAFTSSNAASINKVGGMRVFKSADATKQEFRAGWENDFSGTDVVPFTEAKYRHIDILVDMDARTLTTYIDGKKMNSNINKLPESFTSVNSIFFSSGLASAAVLVDNVRIVQNPSLSSIEIAEDTILFEDTFTRAAGAIGSSWVYQSTSNPWIDKNLTHTTSGVLWAWSTNANFAYSLKTPVTYGKVLLSFDFNANNLPDNTDSNERYLKIYVCGEDVTSANIASVDTLSRIGSLNIFKNQPNTEYLFRSGAGEAEFSTTVTKAMDKNDHHFDIMIDMTNRTATTYFDNAEWNTFTLPSGFNSVNALAFKANLNTASTLIDNVRIVQNPTTKIESIKLNEAFKYVDITINQPITSALPMVSDITFKNTANDAVVVTSVTKPAANVIRVSYQDLLTPGKYSISLADKVETAAGDVLINGEVEAKAIIAVAEDFSKTAIDGGAINSWLTIRQPDNTAVMVENGRLSVTPTTDHTQWENVVTLSVLQNEDFANVYKAIRNGGTASGSVFTAETTHLGTLSYEFDVNISAANSTILMFNTSKGTRQFRVYAGSSTNAGFYAGTSQRLTDFAAGQTYSVKVSYDFENQNVSYYIDGILVGTTLFTDTIYNDNKTLVDNDMFLLALGVEKGKTVYFDNIAVTYEAKDYRLQNFDVTSENGGYKVTGAVVNPFNADKDAIVLFAAYKDGAVVYADLLDASVPAVNQTAIDKVFAVPETVLYDSVKVFAWRDLTTLKPLVTAVVPQ